MPGYLKESLKHREFPKFQGIILSKWTILVGQDLSWGCGDGGGGGGGGLESAELVMTSVSRHGARHQVQGQAPPGPPAHSLPGSLDESVCVGASRPRRDLRLTQKVILQLIWDSFDPF